MKYPIHKTLNEIKACISKAASTFSTNRILIKDIPRGSGGRVPVHSVHWPLLETLKLLEKESAIKIDGNEIEILNLEYFEISMQDLEIPISFSIEKKIEADLTVMTMIYAEMYDIENRLRFFLSEKLLKKYGENYIQKLSTKVQKSINNEKNKTRPYLIDARTSHLEFSNFSDLINIFTNEPEFITNKNDLTTLKEKLEHLNSVRNVTSHHTPIVPRDIQKIKDYCSLTREILKNNK